MSNWNINLLKQLNLVEFLSQHYGLEFRQVGSTYQCCSPFTNETRPSFFVRLMEDGHWLFKDYSSDAGGSIFDFVQMKEKLSSFTESLTFIRKLIGHPLCSTNGEPPADDATEGHELSDSKSYDVKRLYERFRQNDADICREYLLRRGIDPKLVEALIADETVVHNQHEGQSYCCFVVRDAEGRLQCLDNHAVDGSSKFVLGKKKPFSCDWEALPRAREVFLAEGILDYLSIKSLELSPPPGMALLGNQLCFDPGLLEKTKTILSAMDDDRGGNSAVLDLHERYPEKQVRVYDLEGHKDPNALLVAARAGKGRTLNPEKKIQLYREFQQAGNKSEVAQRWGIDRSYLYQIVRECEEILAEAFSQRRRGRPPKGKPATLDAALARIAELGHQIEPERMCFSRERKEGCQLRQLANPYVTVARWPCW